MAQSVSRRVVRAVVDHILPDNCRRELSRACERNNMAACDIMALIQDNRSSLLSELKRDRRKTDRG